MRPQSNGMAERYMRTIVNMSISMAYRSSEHETSGISSCQMMFGREINLPVDLVMGRPSNNLDNSNS